MTTFEETQEQSAPLQTPKPPPTDARRHSSAASGILIQNTSQQLDQDLAEKLARRLQLSDAVPDEVACTGGDSVVTCDHHHSACPIDDMLSERRQRQRLLLARCSPCVCPQLAAKLANRLEKSESADSDVSETSFSLIAAQSTPTPPPRPSLAASSPSQLQQLPQQQQQPRALPPSAEHPLEKLPSSRKNFNPCLEFPEFSRRDINRLKEAFVMYDADGDNFIGFNDLKLMMEKLGAPQTHLGLKAMIKEVDEDQDSRINFREFLIIFRKARAGQLDYSGELLAWYDCYVEVSEINVEEVGVMEAKNFFESKIAIHSADGKLQAKLRDQRLQRLAEEEEKQRSRESFQSKRAMFT